jgi:putative nucleotidyltransferase-like protein
MKLLSTMLKPDLKTQLRMSRGRLVAGLLSESWQRSPSLSFDSAEELSEIAPLLLKLGGGGLAWRRMRGSSLQASEVARLFQQAYRAQSIQGAVHQHRLKTILRLLRSRGVEPVLVKGWAIARLYPEPGMRPYGDLDLCALPEHYEAAKDALRSPEGRECSVDLHLGFGSFYDRRTDDVFSRSELIKLDDAEVRVLSAEDHLRFLCMHLLRHGAVRPLWLCDIAVLLEKSGNDFDWDRCLSGSRRQSDWIACAIGLAHQLMGLDVEGMPIADRARNLPKWLLPAALYQWGSPAQIRSEVAVYLRHPAKLLRALPTELPRHWPNPIEATVTLKGPFNELPRLPFQVAHMFSRATSALLQAFGITRREFIPGIE